MTRNIVFACVIFTFFAQAVELSDFEPLIKEARIKKEIPQEFSFAPKDSKEFYNTPQIKIFQLIKTYQQEHFSFNATLANIAKQEIQNLSNTYDKEEAQEIQKLINDFIKNYQKAQRIWLLNILTNFYDDEYFANESYETNKNKQYEQITMLVNEFFGEQERFILSGGDRILRVIFAESNQEVCMEASCGHPTELFILSNTYNALKTTKNEAKLKEIADYGLQGYKRYLLLKSITSDEIYKTFKELNYENLALTNPSKRQLYDFKAEFDIDSDEILAGFTKYFASWYLGELYSAKYALALAAKKASAKEIVDEAFGGKIRFCQISKYLDKQAQKLCLDKIDIKQEWIFLNDKQVCAHIEQNTIIKSPTNNTSLCQAIQKEIQKQIKNKKPNKAK